MSHDLLDLTDDVALLKDLGGSLANPSLKDALGKVLDASGEIPDKYKPLLKPLSAFAVGDPAGMVSWAIAGPDKPSVATSQYSVQLDASASLTLNAADTWPGDAQHAQRLSLAAAGKIGAGVSATVPYAYGSVTAGAQTAADTTLTYYFRAKPETIFAIAVGGELAALANPFDFDSVWNRMKDSDLDGISFQLGGSAKVQARVSLGDAVALGQGVKADLSATVGVSAALAGQYRLSFHRTVTAAGAFALQASLTRNPSLTTDVTGSLGVAVDVSALTKPVLDAMTTAAADWDQALSEIKPFLSPGTWLRDHAVEALNGQITALIKDQGLRAALITDLDAALGAQDITDEGLTAWLTGRLTGAIDQGSALIDGQIGAASDRVMAVLKGSLPNVVTKLAQQDVDKLKALVTNSLTTLEEGLKGEAAKLLATPAAALKAALTKAGAAVTGAVDTLDGALAAVRDLLTKVDTKFHDILGAAEDALKQKITAKLSFDDTTSKGAMVEVAGTFVAADDDARKVFKALVLGDLPTLVNVVDGRLAGASFQLDHDQSSVTRFSKSKSTTGLEVAFLNVDMTLSEVITGNATIVVDGLGNVHVSSDAGVTKVFTSLFNTRQVSFSDTHSLVLAGQMKNDDAVGVPVLEVGISASFSKNSLSLNDVQTFIQGLTQVGLVSTGASDKAKASFDAWAHAANAGGAISGSIGGALRLSGDQITTLLRMGQRDPAGAGLSRAGKQAVITAGLTALRQTGALNARHFANGKANALSQFAHPPAAEADIILDYRRQGVGIPDDLLPKKDSPSPELQAAVFTDQSDDDDYCYFLGKAYTLLQLSDLVGRMGDIYLSKASTDGHGAGWKVDDYLKAQTALADDSAAWLTLFQDLVGLFNSKITRSTLAFMRVMADLAGMDGKPGGVMLTLTYAPASGPKQTIAFG